MNKMIKLQKSDVDRLFFASTLAFCVSDRTTFNDDQAEHLLTFASLQWLSCRLIFGVAEHLLEHLLGGHTKPSLAKVKCQWRGCGLFFGSPQAVKQVRRRRVCRLPVDGFGRQRRPSALCFPAGAARTHAEPRGEGQRGSALRAGLRRGQAAHPFVLNSSGGFPS